MKIFKRNLFSRFFKLLANFFRAFIPSFEKCIYFPFLKFFGKKLINADYDIECIMFGQSPGYAEGKILGQNFFFFGENLNQWRIEVSLSLDDIKKIGTPKDFNNLIDGPFESVEGNIFSFGSSSDIASCDFDYWDNQETLISCSKYLKKRISKNE